MKTTTATWSKHRHRKIAKQREEIVSLLTEGKTQWEVHKMGYPFGTVRYHYQKLFRPKQHKKFIERHKERMRERAKLSPNGK